MRVYQDISQKDLSFFLSHYLLSPSSYYLTCYCIKDSPRPDLSQITVGANELGKLRSHGTDFI